MLKKSTARVCGGILTLCLLLALASCGEGKETRSGPVPAPGAASASPGAPAAWQTFLLGQEACGPDGTYICQPRPENSGYNILYADYATGQYVFLCNRPECTHADETCPSFRQRQCSLFFSGGRLYVMDSGRTDDDSLPKTPTLWVCDKNGENAKMLFEVPGDVSGGWVATDGTGMYTLETEERSIDDKTLALSFYLTRYGLADGTNTRVSGEDFGSAGIFTAFGDEIVLRTHSTANIEDYYSVDTGAEFVGVNTGTGTRRSIHTVAAGQIAGADGGKAYVLRMKDGAVDAIDLQTGEVQTTAFDNTAIKQYMYVPDPSEVSAEEVARILANPLPSYDIRGIYDGKIFLHCTEDVIDDTVYQTVTYAIDVFTGEVTRATLSMSFELRSGLPIYILDETESDFFVLRDYANTPFPSADRDGNPYEAPFITNQYALIAKEDFYASNPNYRDFVLS